MLTIEDGTCVEGADTFVSLADAEMHFAKFGGYWTGDPSDKEAALRRGALWLSTAINWHGTKPCNANILAWPRSGAKDCYGNKVASDSIPQQIIYAQLYAASVELQTPGALTPSITPGQQVRREKVDVLEVEYMTPLQQGVAPGTYNAERDMRPIFTQINDLIKCFADVNTRKLPWPFVV